MATIDAMIAVLTKEIKADMPPDMADKIRKRMNIEIIKADAKVAHEAHVAAVVRGLSLRAWVFEAIREKLSREAPPKK